MTSAHAKYNYAYAKGIDKGIERARMENQSAESRVMLALFVVVISAVILTVIVGAYFEQKRRVRNLWRHRKYAR